MSVNSTVNKRYPSTFAIPGVASPSRSSPGPADTEKNRVMICDDQEDILYICATYLRRSYDVLVAKSGKECLSMFVDAKKNGEAIKVLLLDYRLGDMSGEDVVRNLSIKELCGRTRIVFITAADLEENTFFRLRLACGRAVGELRKPFNMRELEDRVAAAVAEQDSST